VVVSFIGGGNWSTQIKPLLISNDFLYFSEDRRPQIVLRR
jgi:hypothetical protein